MSIPSQTHYVRKHGVSFEDAIVAFADPLALMAQDRIERLAQRWQQEATEHDAWFRREVQIGLDAANAGDVVSAEEVEAQAVAWRADTRR